MKLQILLRFAGAAQLGLLTAGATMSLVTDMRPQLRRLDPFLRQLFWVYFGFMGWVLAGMGALTLLLAPELARGGALAGGICSFLAVFWLARLAIQFTVFDVRPYLGHPGLRMGYHATSAVFLYLGAVFTGAAWHALALGPAGGPA